MSHLHGMQRRMISVDNFWLALGSKPVLGSFSDIQCVFLEDSRRHCIFL